MKNRNTLVQTENSGKFISGGYVIPSEVAVGISNAVLAEYRGYLKSELKSWRKNPKSPENPDGYWLHPDDVVLNTRLIAAMDLLLDNYFGATNE